jgi:quinol monooxygenase YgiN
MVLIAKLKAKQEQAEAMENALRQMVKQVETESGTLIYTLHRSPNEPNLFMFYEKYRDGAALQEHSSTPHFKALFDTLKPMLDGQPQIEMYEEIAALNR